jgi:nicotinate-nucleotide adenylyltransferase
MLQLALMPYPTFEIDTREMDRKTPSFMIETLRDFRAELGHNTSLTLMLGWDAFLQLPNWHQWRAILETSHILVVMRPYINKEPLPLVLKYVLEQHQVSQPPSLLHTAQGSILTLEAGNYPISSQQIREALLLQQDVTNMLPETVLHYIKEQGLYVSS